MLENFDEARESLEKELNLKPDKIEREDKETDKKTVDKNKEE